MFKNLLYLIILAVFIAKCTKKSTSSTKAAIPLKPNYCTGSVVQYTNEKKDISKNCLIAWGEGVINAASGMGPAASMVFEVEVVDKIKAEETIRFEVYGKIRKNVKIRASQSSMDHPESIDGWILPYVNQKGFEKNWAGSVHFFNVPLVKGSPFSFEYELNGANKKIKGIAYGVLGKKPQNDTDYKIPKELVATYKLPL